MKIKGRISQNTIIVLCCLLYTFAYLGRYSYNSNITLIIDDYGVTKAQAGLASTFFFFAYGIGQVVNGILCSKYNKRWIFPIALTISALINFIVFFGVPFDAIKYLWLLNGFVQSCLWSSIISVISKTVEEKNMNRAVVLLSFTAGAGTILVYGFSSLFAYLNNYKLSFFVSAVFMAVIGLIWLYLYSPKLEINEEKIKKEVQNNEGEGLKGIAILMTGLALFAIIHNVVKDGLTTWAPDILKDWYMLDDSVSILLTAILPFAGILGGLWAISISKRLNNFLCAISVFFAIATISVGAIIIIPHMNAIAAVILFGVVVCATHGINNIITSIAPLNLRGKIESGKMAGIMNGFCYAGSTVSSYGLGKIADFGGWHYVLNIIFGMCILSAFLGFSYFIAEKIKRT